MQGSTRRLCGTHAADCGKHRSSAQQRACACAGACTFACVDATVDAHGWAEGVGSIARFERTGAYERADFQSAHVETLNVGQRL
eukprot:6210750-Pleurochrysis_carterae.AAC.2